ncbi:hypothetical protein HDU89_002827 [Geranomyces variabilis]|nr:hypothetical protein HDU89_002827 [Geranomyces variabilis]
MSPRDDVSPRRRSSSRSRSQSHSPRRSSFKTSPRHQPSSPRRHSPPPHDRRNASPPSPRRQQQRYDGRYNDHSARRDDYSDRGANNDQAGSREYDDRPAYDNGRGRSPPRRPPPQRYDAYYRRSDVDWDRRYERGMSADRDRHRSYGGGGPGGGPGGGGGGGRYPEFGPRQGETFQQFLERRRDTREASTATIWLASPDSRPARDSSFSPDRKRKKDEKKDKKKSKKDKKKSSRSSRKRRRSVLSDSAVSDDSVDSSEDEDRDRRSKRRRSVSRDGSRKRKSSDGKRSSRKKKRAETPTLSVSSASDGDERRATRRRSRSRTRSRSTRARSRSASQPTATAATTTAAVEVDDTVQDYWREKAVEPLEDAPVGPMPLPAAEAKHDERAYGGALLAGEGSAMAAYLQSGKRIPRRGEIGLTSNEIENYEGVGFVMSGNRHRRMNAVRIRKENQVISAEEKRALLLFNQEANQKKESEIIANFKDMVTSKMRAKEDPLAE